MNKRLIALLCALALTGCRSWDVNVFGVELDTGRVKAATSSDLTTDEKVGVVVVLGLAVAIGVGAVALAD